MGFLSATLLVCGLSILGMTLFRSYKLSVNYIEAKKFGIPIKILPFNRQDDLWLFWWRHFYYLLKALPFGWGNWVDYSAHGWNVNIRWKEHEDLGDCFVLVTPNQNEIVFTDPVAGLELESKYKTWFKPQHHYYIFNLFGKNLLTVNGDEWQRHRKITSPVFRELTYKLVWTEALRQAEQMFRVSSKRLQLDQCGSNYMEDIKKDAIIFAMHVLSAVGFGHTHDFDKGLRQVPPGHAVSFSGVMWFIFEKFLRVVMFRNLHLPAWLAPQWLTAIHLHLAEFQQYAQESIDRQRKAGPSPIGSGADMVSALIAANEVVKNEEKSISTPAGKRSYLDDSELYGNMFIFNLVGFEPPFNAVIHVIPFLAAHSQVQAWAREEVDTVLKQENIEDYEKVFPRLVRCQAVLYEVLRFWGPLGDTTRICLNEPQPLQVGKHHLLIPPKVYVNWDFAGAQTDPRRWGSDAMEYRPERWIRTDPNTGEEVLEAPSPAAELAFNPWSGGPRVCPGKKFSQVEIVAMTATLLRSYSVKPMLVPGKLVATEADAQRELMRVMNDLELPRLSKTERFREVGVVFSAR